MAVDTVATAAGDDRVGWGGDGSNRGAALEVCLLTRVEQDGREEEPSGVLRFFRSLHGSSCSADELVNGWSLDFAS